MKFQIQEKITRYGTWDAEAERQLKLWQKDTEYKAAQFTDEDWKENEGEFFAFATVKNQAGEKVGNVRHLVTI